MIKNNDVVTINYSVSTVDGIELDASDENEPLVALLGAGFLIQGLEEALIGKTVGDSFVVTVEEDKAYGPRHESLVQPVPHSMFEGLEVEPGMSFRATTDDGEQSVIVIDVDDEQVVVDGNHPLSGMALTFNVTILAARSATEEELSSGNVADTNPIHH